MKAKTFIANALGHSMVDKRVEILRLIGKTGSISQAAREAGVSYKAAWQAVDTLTNLSGVTLVEKVVGGTGGGGAQLTKAGEKLLSTADLLEKVRQEVLTQLHAGNANISSKTLSQLAIRTSMRNHLPCRVIDLEINGQIVRVRLQLPGGEEIVARITRASAELLALEIDQRVLALFKATAVAVEPFAVPERMPGKNIITGRAARVMSGDEENEISVELSAGLQLVGFAVAGSAIKSRSRVNAQVDESAIVIALIE